MKVDLSGRVALVTGAGRHIGRAIADAFVTNGAIVIYSDIDEDAARVAAQHRPAIAFAQTEAVRLDVTDEVAVNAVISGVVKRHGRLDVVVNNAGINTSAHRVTVDRFPKVEWDRILDVDLTGLYLVSKACGWCYDRPGLRKNYQHWLGDGARSGKVAVCLHRCEGRCSESHAGNGN